MIKAVNIFIIFIFFSMASAVLGAMQYHFRAAIYPIVVGSLGCLISILLLVKNLIKDSEIDGGESIDIQQDKDLPSSVRLKKSVKAFAAVITLYVLIWLLGFKLAALIFIAGFIGIIAREKWYITLGLAFGVAILLMVFKEILHVFWPEGLLGELVGSAFPWLF